MTRRESTEVAFIQNTRLKLTYQRYLTAVESRKSLASRTHFEVPGDGLKGQEALGLEAYKFLKIPCPQPRTALFFESLKMGHGHDFFTSVILKNARKFVKALFFGNV